MWASEHINKELSKMMTTNHNNNKNKFRGKILQNVLKI